MTKPKKKTTPASNYHGHSVISTTSTVSPTTPSPLLHSQSTEQPLQEEHSHSHHHNQAGSSLMKQYLPSKLKHSNTLASSLSRSINCFTIVKDSQLKSIANRYEKLNSIADKIEISLPVWDTIIEARHTQIDSFINATTSALIQSVRSESLIQINSATPAMSDSLSKAYKSRGNELFQKKQYLDALLLYTEALRLYDTESNKDQQVLSSIYSNRCLCLVHLEKFEEGATEATRGLECRSSDYLVHKLLYRRGICYFSMKKHHKAKQDFQEAHKLVSKMSDASDIQSIESYLEKINKMNLGDLIEKEPAPESTHPSIVDQRITFKYGSESIGRYCEATDNVQSNTILFQERAYVSCLDRYSHSSYCHNCFKEILAPIYCKKCNHAQYCGEECLNEDRDNFHEKECGKGFLLLCSSESLLAIRILLKKSKERKKSKPYIPTDLNLDNQYIPAPTGIFNQPEPEVISNDSSSDNNRSISIQHKIISNNPSDLLDNIQDDTDGMNGEPIQSKSNIYTPNYDLIYSFDPHFKEHPNSKLASIIFDSFILDRFLDIHHKSLGISKDDYNIFILIRHLCQLSTYIFSIPVFVGQDDMCQHGIQRFLSLKVAYAIYPTASLLNHSCDNNTLLQYKGNSIIIKSLKDIEKNEEVSISYGPHIYHLDIRERLKALKSEYFFICRCKACNEKAGPNPLKCPTFAKLNCPGTLLETVNVAKLSYEKEEDEEGLSFDDYNDRVFICNKCGVELRNNETGLLTSVTLLSNILFNTASKQLANNELKETEDILTKCLEMRHKIFQENSKKIGEVYDSFARLYIQEDNYKDAVKYAEKAVHNMFVRLGHSHSTELARECAKLANIYINGGEPIKAIKAINTAEALLVKWKTETGDDEILAQLRNHKKVLEASKVIPGTNKVEINLTQLWSQPDFDSDTFLHRMILYHNKS